MISFLKSPKAIGIAFILVGIISTYFPEIALYLAKPGDMYLTLLQMCIMPLLMMSIIKAIASVVSLKSQTDTTRQFLLIYMGVAFGASLFTMFFSHIGQLGYHITENPVFIKLISANAQSQTLWVDLEDPLDQSKSLIDILRSIVTHNIFVSLMDALILQVMFFSCLVGAAAGFLQDKQKDIFFSLIGASDAIFKKIIGWIMTFLPLGIVCIFSIKFVNLPLDILKVLLIAIMYFIGLIFIISALLNFVIAHKLQLPYLDVVYRFSHILMISATTGSPIATMPSYMQTLINEFNIKETDVDLYIPLSIALFRFGNIFYLGFLSILTAQIFAIPLGLTDYVNALFLIFFAGFASVSSGIINVGLLSMILSPLGVPSSFAITLFAAIDPIVEPFRTAFTMYVHLFCAVLTLKKHEK